MCMYLPSQVRSHEASQSIECHARVILAVTGDILTNHVSSQHHHIEVVMETLGGSKVANTLGGGGERVKMKYLEHARRGRE